MEKSESIKEICIAFNKMQSVLEQPLKDKNNPFFNSKYVPLENVVDSIVKASKDNGLSFSQFAETDENGNICVSTLVMHNSGEWIQYPKLRMKPEKNTPQSLGSAITYAKRYALSAIFGITSDEDSDGNSESKQNKNTKQKQNNRPVQKITIVQAQELADEIQEIANITQADYDAIQKMVLEAFKIDTLSDIHAIDFKQAVQYVENLKRKAFDKYGNKESKEEK